MPTRLRAHEREFPQEETVALGQFCGESIGSLRVLPSCLSSPLRDAPRGSVGAAIGGDGARTTARERRQGGARKKVLVLCRPDDPTKAHRPHGVPPAPPD